MRVRVHIAALLAAGAAYGEGITGYVEEDYSHTDLRTDANGVETRSAQDAILQRYHLNLDHGFYPQLRFSGGGTFEQQNAWGGQSGSGWTRTLGGFGQLAAGNRVLNSTAAYNYRTERQSGSNDHLVLEEPSITVGWRPSLLPQFSLRVARTHTYDVERQIEDLAVWTALFTARYSAGNDLTLQYSAIYTNPNDRLNDTDTRSISQLTRADYLHNFWEGRASISAGAAVNDRRTETTTAGAGGTLSTPQTPVSAMALVQKFPATVQLDTLVDNGALSDGNTSQGIAGLDIGTAQSAGTEIDPREIGARFADILTPVNTLYVYVDRQLPAQISASFQWTAWQSDDNLHWAQIAIPAPIVFGTFLNRFEITIRTTAAHFLKVVVSPLAESVTTDRRFSSILVTELQLYLVTPALRTSGWQAQTRELFNSAARVQITKTVAYDFTGLFVHGTQTGGATLNTWLIGNGLSYARRFNPIFFGNARIARQDQDQSSGHQGVFVYSASLAATPLATLSHNLVYSGQLLTDSHGANTITNSLSFYNRATPYRGTGLLAGAGYNLIKAPSGLLLRSAQLTFGASAQPHRTLSFSGLFAHSDTVSEGGGTPRAAQATNRVDGSMSFNPVPALYVSTTISRLITNGVGRTLANGTGSFSPFAGGALQFALSYTETYQEPSQLTRIIVPTLRWNVRPGSLLTVSYTVLDATGLGAGTHARTFDVNFQTTL